MEPVHNPEPEKPERGRRGFSHAFWITIILIVVAARALPNFIKARTTRSKAPCIANLKQMDGAFQQWALENKKLDGDPVNLSEALNYLQGGKLPTCPDGGSYSAGNSVSEPPKCSLGIKSAAHRLP